MDLRTRMTRRGNGRLAGEERAGYINNGASRPDPFTILAR